jgi:hypothetical protein
MISDVLPITAWEEGFRKTAAQESIKVLLEPGPEAVRGPARNDASRAKGNG